MKWRKPIANYPKWTGHLRGKHVATILRNGVTDFRVWIDAGDGFREVQTLIRCSSLKQWKTFCEAAYIFLEVQLEIGVEA